MNEINETATTAGDTPDLPGDPAPRNSTELLAEVNSFLEEWEDRAEDLAFFPSPAGTHPPAEGADGHGAVSAVLARAAELVRQFREDDAEAVDYYHLSDIAASELRDSAEELLARVAACDPTLAGTPGYIDLQRTLELCPNADHPLWVFRRVWASWLAAGNRGTDGLPLPPVDPALERLLTEAGVDPAPSNGPEDAVSAGQPRVDLAAENARLRALVAEMLLAHQRATGEIRRFLPQPERPNAR
ncbi:MAG: hypothetical protein C0501_14235 [Isosphaera sp.]|nr:hypothetical protein [Isosphaera sp.]